MSLSPEVLEALGLYSFTDEAAEILGKDADRWRTQLRDSRGRWVDELPSADTAESAAVGVEAVLNCTGGYHPIPTKTSFRIKYIDGELRETDQQVTHMTKEAELIANYRTNNYKVTNKKLRQGIVDPRRVPSMPALDARMVPATADFIVHRVVQQKFGYHEAEIGSTFTDPAYTYTTSSPEQIDAILDNTTLVHGKASHITIRVKKGSMVMNMSAVDYDYDSLGWGGMDEAYYNARAEVLLARNTTMTLVGKTQLDDGSWQLDMEVSP